LLTAPREMPGHPARRFDHMGLRDRKHEGSNRAQGAARGLRPCGLTTSGASRASHRPTAPACAGWRPCTPRAPPSGADHAVPPGAAARRDLQHAGRRRCRRRLPHRAAWSRVQARRLMRVSPMSRRHRCQPPCNAIATPAWETACNPLRGSSQPPSNCFHVDPFLIVTEPGDSEMSASRVCVCALLCTAVSAALSPAAAAIITGDLARIGNSNAPQSPTTRPQPAKTGRLRQ
jgi:hypothetical protein